MKKHTSAFILICSIFLLFYSGYRAYQIPITHDEAGSYIYFYNENILECVSDPICWNSANNHWLNTFLFQKTARIFGMNEFTLRLPNWFAHWIYIISCVLILRKIKLSDELFLLGFVLLNFNPFLIDFFSTARGYGMLNGFVLASIVSLIYYFKNNKQRYFVASTSFACLGVLSCFTGLNFLMSLLTFCGLLGIWYFFQSKKVFNIFLKHFLFASVPVVITAAIVFFPLTVLMKKGEFLWGCDSIFETFSVILQDSLAGQKYLSTETTVPFFLLISTLLVGAGVLAALIAFLKDKKPNPSIIFPGGLLLIAVFILIAQNLFLGSKFFVNRKSLTLMITATLALIFGFKILYEKYPKIIRTTSWILIIFSFLHFSRCMNFRNIREWWYDEYTREMLEYVEKDHEKGTQVNLGMHWFFHPSSTFYTRIKDYDFINPLIYSKEILTDKKFDYYYVLKENLPLLERDYQIEKAFSSELFLLKKKNKK